AQDGEYGRAAQAAGDKREAVARWLLTALLLDVQRLLRRGLGERAVERAEGSGLVRPTTADRHADERVGLVEAVHAHRVGETVVLGHLAEVVGLLAEPLAQQHRGPAPAARVRADLADLGTGQVD